MQVQTHETMKTEKLQLGNFQIDIIDNPLEILSKEEIEKLVNECIPVARKGFGNDEITYTDIETHAVEVTTGIYVRDKDENMIAFGGSVPEKIEGKTVLHLKGSAVLPEYQGQGLYSAITPIRVLREAEKLGNNVYIGTRTQNPRVFEYMTEKLDFFPKIDQTTPEEIKKIAKEYASLVQEKHSDFKPKNSVVFDADNLVVRRAYGGEKENGEEFGFCMYQNNIPHARDKGINSFMYNNLDFDNGDAVILIGKFNKYTYVKSLESIVERINPVIRLYNRFS